MPGKVYLAKIYFSKIHFLKLIVILFVATTGCAYRWAGGGRTLPGGYTQVHIPMFKNYSLEPGIEVAFTDQLKTQFERSKIARISEPAESEVILVGEIDNVTYSSAQSDTKDLPTGAVITSTYRIIIDAKLTLLRFADKSVLWSGGFKSDRTYAAPRVKQAIINTLNPLYNLSARRQNIEVMASAMMTEAHNRITENF